MQNINKNNKTMNTKEKKITFKGVMKTLGLVAVGFGIGALVQKRVDVVEGTKALGQKAWNGVSDAVKKIRAPKAQQVSQINDNRNNYKFNN
jgi:hypothetical protein